MSTARSELRLELTRALLPALRDLGFAGPEAISGNALLHDYRREAGSETHVLTVQLEKNGLPRFTLNLCIEPPEGFEVLVQRGGTIHKGRVQPRPGPSARTWFRTDPSFWKRIAGRARSASAASVVAECVSLLPEIEAWWGNQANSPHIKVLVQSFPGVVH